MEKEIKKKLSVIDPRFRKEIQDLLSHMHESISLLYDAATRDEKTGLYNNKFFETILEMEMEKAKRGKQKLSLVIIDIDFFKKINDTYGHIRADEMLEKLAKVILGAIRKSDIAARFGGEEFVILLPETPLEKAKKFCSRLKNSINNNKFLKKYKMTVSGGITQFKGKDSKKIFESRADKAMYQAKNSGRNKFIALE